MLELLQDGPMPVRDLPAAIEVERNKLPAELREAEVGAR